MRKTAGVGLFIIQRSFLLSWRMVRTLARGVRASPRGVQIVLIPILGLSVWLGANWAYQSFHKPTEILFPLDPLLAKPPAETWQEYQALFHEHATATITPEFLAALAQVESDGNPVARTYWRWQWGWNPLDWYQPASSAVGMYQMTDGTFQEASRFCIHDHTVVEDGPWHAWRSCWFNALYTRILPSHAVEMTAALLDRQVAQTLKSQQRHKATLKQKQNLAAIIHLCGFRTGQTYAARQFRLHPHQRCGDHAVKAFLTKLNDLKGFFEKPEKREPAIQKAR